MHPDYNNRDFQEFLTKQQPLFVLEMAWASFTQLNDIDKGITLEEIEEFERKLGEI